VLRELERLRIAEQIGAPLDAVVELYGTPEWHAALDPLGEELRFVLITSEARVGNDGERPADAIPADADGKSGLWLRVRPSSATKCVRCWHKRDDVGTVAAHPELCGRCAANLDGPGETRRYA
jgi:isoleucyl-tRNA synthetase